ncbi:MAG: hypothetical protein ACRDWI_04195 [Jiangellaceae bacterium]
MYSLIWRSLPGPWPMRLLILLVLIAAIVVALFLWVFPWAVETFGIDRDVTVS